MLFLLDVDIKVIIGNCQCLYKDSCPNAIIKDIGVIFWHAELNALTMQNWKQIYESQHDKLHKYK